MASLKDLPSIVTFDAKPYPFQFPLRNTALLVIDMQRDFVSSGGFGEIQGGDLRMVQESIAPTKALLEACRNAGLQIFHTREGQVPDLSDCPSSKLHRQAAAPGNTQHMKVIGDKGEMGRLLGKILRGSESRRPLTLFSKFAGNMARTSLTNSSRCPTKLLSTSLERVLSGTRLLCTSSKRVALPTCSSLA
jgi:hypothetical protein